MGALAMNSGLRCSARARETRVRETGRLAQLRV